MDETRRSKEGRTSAATVAEDGSRAPTVGDVLAQNEVTPSIGTLQPGHLVAERYRIEHLVGVGGMGAVYKATDERLRRAVALKTLAPFATNDSDARRRFETEARAASAIHHAGVVAVHDFGVDGPMPFIVLEYLRGEDLAAVLNRQMRLDVAATTDIMLGVCAGVFAAHEAGVIHRDLKPSNVFTVKGSGVQTVKVLDFGVSKLVSSREHSLTGKGDIIGTIDYMSPEQAGGRPVDARSDQFSLGVILYRCVTGRTPHRGETTVETLRRILVGDFPRPRQLVPELPAEFEALLCRAMALEPEGRFPSVHHLGRALLAHASERGRRQWTDTFDGQAPSQSTTQAARGVDAPPRPGSGTQTFPAPATVLQPGPPEPELPSTRTVLPGERPSQGVSATVQPVMADAASPMAIGSGGGRPRHRWTVVLAGLAVLAAAGWGLAWFGSAHRAKNAPEAHAPAPLPAPALLPDASASEDAGTDVRAAPSAQPAASATETQRSGRTRPARTPKPRPEAIKYTPNGVPILR